MNLKKQANAVFILVTCSIIGVVNAMLLKTLYDSATNTLINDLMSHFGISNITSLMAGVLLLWLMIGIILGIHKEA